MFSTELRGSVQWPRTAVILLFLCSGSVTGRPQISENRGREDAHLPNDAASASGDQRFFPELLFEPSLESAVSPPVIYRRASPTPPFRPRPSYGAQDQAVRQGKNFLAESHDYNYNYIPVANINDPRKVSASSPYRGLQQNIPSLGEDDIDVDRLLAHHLESGGKDGNDDDDEEVPDLWHQNIRGSVGNVGVNNKKSPLMKSLEVRPRYDFDLNNPSQEWLASPDVLDSDAPPLQRAAADMDADSWINLDIRNKIPATVDDIAMVLEELQRSKPIPRPSTPFVSRPQYRPTPVNTPVYEKWINPRMKEIGKDSPFYATSSTNRLPIGEGVIRPTIYPELVTDKIADAIEKRLLDSNLLRTMSGSNTINIKNAAASRVAAAGETKDDDDDVDDEVGSGANPFDRDDEEDNSVPMELVEQVIRAMDSGPTWREAVESDWEDLALMWEDEEMDEEEEDDDSSDDDYYDDDYDDDEDYEDDEMYWEPEEVFDPRKSRLIALIFETIYDSDEGLDDEMGDETAPYEDNSNLWQVLNNFPFPMLLGTTTDLVEEYDDDYSDEYDYDDEDYDEEYNDDDNDDDDDYEDEEDYDDEDYDDDEDDDEYDGKFDVSFDTEKRYLKDNLDNESGEDMPLSKTFFDECDDCDDDDDFDVDDEFMMLPLPTVFINK